MRAQLRARAAADASVLREEGGFMKVVVPELALVFVGVLVLLFVQYWGSRGAWPALEEVPQLAVTLFLDGAGAPGRRAAVRARA